MWENPNCVGNPNWFLCKRSKNLKLPFLESTQLKFKSHGSFELVSTSSRNAGKPQGPQKLDTLAVHIKNNLSQKRSLSQQMYNITF